MRLSRLAVGSAILLVALFSEEVVRWLGLLGPDFESGRLFTAEFTERKRQEGVARWSLYLAPLVPLVGYVGYEIARACLVHAGAAMALEGLAGTWSVLDDANDRSVLARSVMNIVFLGASGRAGIRMWREFATRADAGASLGALAAALAADEPRAKRLGLGFVPTTPFRRLYAFHPGFHRLSAVTAAFQLKNLVDTVAYGDGALFVVHHIITITAAVLALHPVAQFHGTFFFGVSETSTTLLALLANFDAEHGVPRLESDYPNARLLVGGLFAVSFILVRAIIWPFLTYFFIADCRHVLRREEAHDPFVVLTLAAMLLILTCMQLLWLLQILHALYAELVKPLLRPAPREKLA